MFLLLFGQCHYFLSFFKTFLSSYVDLESIEVELQSFKPKYTIYKFFPSESHDVIMKNENIPVQNCVKAAFKFFTSINKTCWAHSGKIIQNLPSCIESISYIENESLIKIYDDQKTSFKEQVLFIKFIKYWIAMCYVLIICVHGRKDRHSTLFIFTYMYTYVLCLSF